MTPSKAKRFLNLLTKNGDLSRAYCRGALNKAKGGYWSTDGHRAHYVDRYVLEEEALHTNTIDPVEAQIKTLESLIPKGPPTAFAKIEPSTGKTYHERCVALEPLARAAAAFDAWPTYKARDFAIKESASIGGAFTSWTVSGRAVIGINPSYLLDAIPELPCTVEVFGEHDPVVVRGQGWLSIVMPMRR